VETGVPALPKLGLWPLAAALRQADRVVSPDTGLLHLSVVLGVPVLGLFGSSDPVIAGVPAGSGEILRTGIACSPCRERQCQRRQCMDELLPEQVAARF
jgi:ADP-heptose:LPS heptosyltransferase